MMSFVQTQECTDEEKTDKRTDKAGKKKALEHFEGFVGGLDCKKSIA